MLTYLLRPFAFLSINHASNLPKAVCWIFPVTCALCIVLVASLFELKVDVFGSNGAVSRTLGFVQNLPGFYIAALAAISTFGNERMDEVMPGGAPRMRVRHNQGYAEIDLTRRRFLCSMFAYLTALCIAITLLSILALAIAEPIRGTVPMWTYPSLKFAFVLLFATLTAQMTAITFWGLYYLGERVHTPG